MKKKMRKRNPMLRDLLQPKYRLRVVASTMTKQYRKRKHKGANDEQV